MNPYLEERWQDVHASLTIYIRDQLLEKLPPDLVARTEEQTAIDEGAGERSSLRPDVKIFESDQLHEPAVAYAAEPPLEPTLVVLQPESHHWVEIRESGGRLITVLEVLSPKNKSDQGVAAYLRRQRTYIAGGVNLVEIDLLRKGEHVLSVPLSEIPNPPRAPYMICAFRASEPERRELYSFGLRDPLRPFRVPLRPKDEDAPLYLQPLLDQCFERGRYWKLDYRRDLQPPVPPEDAAWMDELLRNSGLRPVSAAAP